jgi:hypothetical protein
MECWWFIDLLRCLLVPAILLDGAPKVFFVHQFSWRVTLPKMKKKKEKNMAKSRQRNY